MRKKEEHLEKEMLEVSAQNRRLAEPLQKAREEMSEMQKKLGDHQRDKQILVVSVPRRPLPPWLLLAQERRDIREMPPGACAGLGPNDRRASESPFSVSGDEVGERVESVSTSTMVGMSQCVFEPVLPGDYSWSRHLQEPPRVHA